MNQKVTYSVIVPVYNSSTSLVELNQRLNTVLSDFEIIFINDGSSDSNTTVTLDSLACQAHISVLHFTRNFGKAAATFAGMKQSKGDYIITMDDDLQHLPEEIPTLLKEKQHAVVSATFDKRKHSLSQKIYSKVKNRIESLTFKKSSKTTIGPFRVIQRHVVDQLLQLEAPHLYIPGMIYFVTNDICNVETQHGKRVYGKSGFTTFKLIKALANLLFQHSSILLKGVSWMGFGVAGFSFLIGGYFLYKKLVIGIPVSGWASLIISLFFLGGLTLLAIGITGEYLIRIIKGVENRPPYIIKQSNEG